MAVRTAWAALAAALVLGIVSLGLLTVWEVRPQPPATPGRALLAARWHCLPHAPTNFHGACDDAATLPNPGRVARLARAHFGSRYAGVWIDQAATPSHLAVGVTGASPADQRILDRIVGARGQVEAVSTRYSQAQLARGLHRARAALATRYRWAVLGVDASDNRIVVAVLPAQRAHVMAALRAAGVPRAMIRVDTYDLAVAA